MIVTTSAMLLAITKFNENENFITETLISSGLRSLDYTDH